MFLDNNESIVKATLNPSGSPSQLTWTYDKWGNRTAQTITEGTLPWSQDTFTFTGNNQILQYGYDAAGNVTGDGTYTYTYDDEGRIISVDNGGTGTYVYEADGLRVRRVGSVADGPEDYVYNLSNQTVATILANGSPQRREIYAGSLHVATYTFVTTFFDYTDWQGSERVRSNVSGVSFETCTNLPYGDDQSCVGSSDPSPKHFTGKLRDTETGLDYSNARYYSSNSGRWMLPDWSAVPEAVPYADPSNPQTLNLYTYVGNNPINGVDADGHQTTDSSGQPCGGYGMYLDVGHTGVLQDATVPCDSPRAAGDPVEVIVDGQVQQPGSQLANSHAVESKEQGEQDQQDQQQAPNGPTPDVTGPAANHQRELVLKLLSNLLSDTQISDLNAELGQGCEAQGGNCTFGMDFALVLAVNKAMGASSDFNGSTFGPHSRYGLSPSLHHNHGRLHIDHFNGSSILGFAPHMAVDVVIGEMFYGSSRVFSY